MPVSWLCRNTRDNSNSRDSALPSHVQLEALPPVFTMQSNVLGGRAAKCPCHGSAVTRESIIEYSNSRDLALRYDNHKNL
jgi:hypothetical protein